MASRHMSHTSKPNGRQQCSRQTSGYTLVELLIALAILSVSLTLLFGGISTAVQRANRTETRDEATQLALSLLAQTGPVWPIQEGPISSGATRFFNWSVEGIPYSSSQPPGSDAMSLIVVKVSVDHAVTNRTAAQLTTLRSKTEAAP